MASKPTCIVDRENPPLVLSVAIHSEQINSTYGLVENAGAVLFEFIWMPATLSHLRGIWQNAYLFSRPARLFFLIR